MGSQRANTDSTVWLQLKLISHCKQIITIHHRSHNPTLPQSHWSSSTTQRWNWPKRTGCGGVSCRNVWNFAQGLKLMANFTTRTGGFNPPPPSIPTLVPPAPVLRSLWLCLCWRRHQAVPDEYGLNKVVLAVAPFQTLGANWTAGRAEDIHEDRRYWPQRTMTTITTTMSCARVCDARIWYGNERNC